MKNNPYFYSRRTAVQLLLSTPLLSTPLVLTGCGRKTPPVRVEPTFEPVRIGIYAVDVITEYTTPETETYIDNKLTSSPARRLINWADATLSPVDERGNLLMTITRAALTKEELEVKGGFKSLFVNEQSHLVRIEVEAYFLFKHPENSRSATITVKAEFEMTMAENTSVDEADQIRLAVVDEGMKRFDAEFRSQLDRTASGTAWPKA